MRMFVNGTEEEFMATYRAGIKRADDVAKLVQIIAPGPLATLIGKAVEAGVMPSCDNCTHGHDSDGTNVFCEEQIDYPLTDHLCAEWVNRS